MNEIDLWLERLYWIAVISLPFLAIWAGRIALRQVQTASQQVDAALQEAQTSKLLKILQHAEEQRVRDARYRLELLKLLQGDVYEEDEPWVLSAMRRAVAEVESDRAHVWHRLLGDLTASAFVDAATGPTSSEPRVSTRPQ